MSRLTGSDAKNLMEAYASVYTPSFTTSLNSIYINEEVFNLFEECLTEEFISEAYHTVADYLVYNGFVPGYNTAEMFMSEMAEEDIDAILFETGVLNEQYLIEAGFFQGLGAGADKFINRAAGAVKRTAQTVGGAAQRAGSAVQRAGQTAVGAAQRAGQTALGAAQRAGSAVQRAGQTAVGAAQRAGGAVVKAATPVAQAIKGTAQRAVTAGKTALNATGSAIKGATQTAVGAAQRAGSAVVGAAQRAGSAVTGAAGNIVRKVGQEIEISRKVGAGEPLSSPKPTLAKPAPAAQGLGKVAVGAAQRVGGAAAVGKYRSSSDGKTYANYNDALAARNSRLKANATPAKPAAAPAARPAAAPAARPAAAPAATGNTMGNPPLAPRPLPPIGGKPSLKSGINDIKAMQADSRKRQGLTQSFDPFDVVLGHLLDEGYADTEEAALVIMSNMSEEWRQSIVEVTYGGDTSTPADKTLEVTNADKKANTPAYQNYLKGDPRYRGAAHLKGV